MRWLSIVLMCAACGCGSVSGTTASSIGTVAMRAAELGGREVVRAIDEAHARDTAASSGPVAGPGERLFFCWLDHDGGEEVVAADVSTARARCRDLHGDRRASWHCRCEAQ